MKTIKLLVFAPALFLSLYSFSQGTLQQQNSNISEIDYSTQIGPNGQIRCNTMQMDALRRANDPTLPSLYQEEMWLQERIVQMKAEQALQKSAGNIPKLTVLTIPIIFHIFTDGAGADNVSATIVQNQLTQLNLDYRNLAGSGFAVAADVEIEFCLAMKNEAGNLLAEPGINRITSYGQGPFSDTQFDGSMKAATIWNPDNYFNVWVANLSGGLLGYAQFPSNSGLGGMPTNGGAANTDGVVIIYTSLGSVANPQGSAGSAYNKGRTLTHESGHWLGLRHVWGDGGCSVDDYCNDTPKSDASNFGCPNTNSCTDAYGAPWPTANPADMVENYMDYTDDACMDTYTADQKTRMRAVMTLSPRRASLAASTKCQVAVGDDAGISSINSPSGSICGSTVNPSVVIYNYGTTTLTSANILYNLDGASNSTYNWTGSLAAGASATVSLGVMSPSAGAHTLNVTTNLPNGAADVNTANDANSSAFTIIVGGEIITLTIDTDCYGEETFWELKDASTAIVASGGNTEVVIPPGGQQLGTAQGDAGAYGVEVQVVENFCLTSGCYDFVLYDDYGDGMNAAGSAAGCSVNGNWVITNASSAVLAQMSSPAFGNSDAGYFCLSAVETANFNVSSPKCVNTQVTFTDASSLATSWNWNFGAGASPATATGVGPHSVTYSSVGTKNVTLSINGGTDVSSQSIVINANPTAPTIAAGGSTTICQGSTVNLTSSQPSGNLWSTNASTATIAASTAGPYTVTYSDVNGCKATSAPTTIAVNALPSASLGSFSNLCVTASPITLTGGTPAGGVYSGTGVSGGTFTPSTAGTGTHVISYTVTDGNNCSRTVTSNIVVDACASIDEIENNSLIVFPNPTNTDLTIVSNTSTISSINVYDAAGRLVETLSDINTNEIKIDVTNYSTGVYNFEIKTETSTLRKRIIKN
jgi:hypothetical protein